MEGGIVESGVPVVVDHVDGRVGEADRRDNVLVAAAGGLHERSPSTASLVGDIRVRAAAEQPGGALAEALGGGVDQGGVAVLVGGVDEVPVAELRAAQEPVDQLRIAVVRRKDQGGVPVLLHIIVQVRGHLVGRQSQLLHCGGLIDHRRSLGGGEPEHRENPGQRRPDPAKDPRERRYRQNPLEYVEDDVQRPPPVVAQEEDPRQPDAASDHSHLLHTLPFRTGLAVLALRGSPAAGAGALERLDARRRAGQVVHVDRLAAAIYLASTWRLQVRVA
mmetsp:Transcript_49810/g.131655  ORF Transcript_49810/g.131655 Transcript_49810/m.131655 type:complete len:276 (+) Transcript_49810:1741-2568(+)